MNLVVNGKEVQTQDGQTVAGLLKDQKVKMPEMVSVELNGEILSRQGFDTTAVGEGDRVEFLYFMGGGGGTI